MTAMTPMGEFESFKNSIPRYKMGKDVKDHLVSLGISPKDIKELASTYADCVESTVNQAYSCCLITMWAGKSKSHQEAMEYVVRKHLESGHRAIKFLHLIAQRTFSIDSPRTAHLPESARAAISNFSAGNAVNFVDGEKLITIYKEDGCDEYHEKKFKDLSDEELDQTFTSTGVYRVKSKQWRWLSSRDRTAIDKHIREDTVWIKQGRRSMTEILTYVDELIKHSTSVEVSTNYVEQLSTILVAANIKCKNMK